MGGVLSRSLARPAAVFVIVAGNWLIAFAEMYRVAKVAGSSSM